ncbi:C39 family peptidase [Allorhizocola rhizosphaerae]|uniref:C39 family peptidase n=1 Tax=Allorhizocola rhizosphaerae TaxID=1872709 RepID=UPI000E3EC5C7|nr:C39 family peptidase [Allorhizocola rhizosphaerae]
MDRRTALRLAVAAAATMGAASTKKPPTPQPQPRHVSYRGFNSDADFASGTSAGAEIAGGAIVFAGPVGQRTYLGTVYDYATWTSPQVPLAFTATQAVPSWTADTPGGSWVEIELRGVTELGTTTAWYNLGRWAYDDAFIARTSVPSQSDVDGRVSIDTWVAALGHGLNSWQLRVTLLRPAGSGDVPRVRSVGAMASRLPAPGSVVPSTPMFAQGTVLGVPPYSQNIHIGEYPQWNGGGEAWCSPTSTSMVLAYWGTGPTPEDYAWVDPSYQDPWVDYAARFTYDANYAGTGNWPFNTAYAGRFGLEAFVTRLRSLNEAERFIAAGIPLVCSLSFKKNQIPGLTYGTNGHLLVVAGFDSSGRPVLNDPAASSNAGVRKVVGRAEFEQAWLDTSGGIAYVIHPASVPVPTW